MDKKNFRELNCMKTNKTGGNKMRWEKSRRMVVLGVLGMFLLLFSVWKTPVMAEDGGNLVGWWKMDEAAWTGATGEVKDVSGKGNNLTAKGTAKMPEIVAIGKVKAAEFKVSESQYLYAPAGNQDLAVGTGDFTLLAWVKSNNLSRRCAILGQQASDYGNSNYGFYQRNHAYHFIVNGPNKGEKWPFFIKSPIRPGWHHLAGAREGDKICFYIDGKLHATKEGASEINPDKDRKYFVIGTGGTKLTEYFEGLITDVKLYKSALSPEQITEEYNRLKDAFGERQKQEMVLYQQDFEKYKVGEKKIKGITGRPDLPDIAVTDNSHYTSTRALRVVYHPESKKDHTLGLSPYFPTSSDCILKVSLRVKFEDVVQSQNRKNLYPYIRVTVYDEKNKQMQTHLLLYSVTTTDSESSADDNWIMLTQEFLPKEGASRFQLVMYMYENKGTSGTVYIDDIKIIQKFKGN